MFTRIANYVNKNEIIEAEKMIGAMNTAKLFEMSALDVYLICCEALGIHPKTHERLEKNVYNPQITTEITVEVKPGKNRKKEIFTKDFKCEVVAYAQKTSVPDASRYYKISKYYIKKWSKERNITNEARGRRYSPEFMEKVITCAENKGISEACKEFDVAYRTVQKWCKELGIITKKVSAKYTHYSEQQKSEIMHYAEKYSIPEASRAYKISPAILRNWFLAKGLIPPAYGKHYTSEFIENVVAYAAEHTISETSEQFEIAFSTVQAWCREADAPVKLKNKSYKNLSDKERNAIIQDVLAEVPLKDVKVKYNISDHILRKVRLEAGIEIQSQYPQRYTEDKKEEIKAYAKTHTARETAKYFNVPNGTIYYILRN